MEYARFQGENARLVRSARLAASAYMSPLRSWVLAFHRSQPRGMGIDGEGRTLETAVSNQWLSEDCPRVTNENDDKNRKRLRDPTGQ